MTGILIVDKPEGWTSQDVTAKLRGVFHERRVGHGGTLDPMATGVLPVFFGRATRAVPFFENAEKEYLVGLRLGVVTDTQDITGSVLSESEAELSEDTLRAALQKMQGPQMQLPPMYSAIKIHGKKLYELAREGKDAERTPRPVELKELELLSFDGKDALFRLLCSKGTYARTVCHDLGQSLGCGACMNSLRRTQAGAYRIEKAFSMEQILSGEAKVLPVDSLFTDLPACSLSEKEQVRCRHGNPIPREDLTPGRYRVYGPDGTFLMLAEEKSGELVTVKSFFEVE